MPLWHLIPWYLCPVPTIQHAYRLPDLWSQITLPWRSYSRQPLTHHMLASHMQTPSMHSVSKLLDSFPLAEAYLSDLLHADGMAVNDVN